MILPSDLAPKHPPQRTKPWLDIDQQVAKLEMRGLPLDDSQRVLLANFLAHQNYYRFSGYFKQFMEPAPADEFKPGTTLEQLLTVYSLDDQMRLLVFRGVQVIEPIIRTRVAFRLAEGAKNGPTRYLLRSAYEPSRPSNLPPRGMPLDAWQAKHAGLTRSRESLMRSIEDTLNREELYLQHFVNQGQQVPLWAMVEAMSLGDLSKMVSTWKDTNQIQRLMDDLGFTRAEELRRAIGNVNFFRNLAAHHNRLWGRRLTRPVAKSPWKGATGLEYSGLPVEAPAHILRLLSDWVDHIQGDQTYSTELWQLVSSDATYEEGMLFPSL
ncbi:Abi family protein [Rothia sp. 11254D007CT]